MVLYDREPTKTNANLLVDGARSHDHNVQGLAVFQGFQGLTQRAAPIAAARPFGDQGRDRQRSREAVLERFAPSCALQQSHVSLAPWSENER